MKMHAEKYIMFAIDELAAHLPSRIYPFMHTVNSEIEKIPLISFNIYKRRKEETTRYSLRKQNQP